MAVPAQTKYILLTILFIIASINFSRTAMEILENSKRIDSISQEVSESEKEKATLEESVSYKKTDMYVEEKARNDLNLIKPGEMVYVLDKGLNRGELSEEVLGTNQVGDVIGHIDEQNRSNPEKWLRLFLR